MSETNRTKNNVGTTATPREGGAAANVIGNNSSQSPPNQSGIWDWFLPAIETQGSVGACLDAVTADLHAKSSFISALRAGLVGKKTDGTDAITEMSSRVKSLENTLRFRLGMLQADRPGAWFRAPVSQTTGPFATSLIPEAVFAEYADASVDEVRRKLLRSWIDATDQNLPFKHQTPCLWRTVLQMNAELERINRLPSPWEGLRLDQMPEALPEVLESRILRAFLIKVKAELVSVRARLDACYQQLVVASEALWNVQREAERAKEREQSRAQAREQTREQAGRWRDQAAETRDEFRKRRQSAQKERAQEARQSVRTSGDLEALRYMGFEKLPSADELRQRYLFLAKTYHPDRGGSEDKFKMLTRAYRQLSARIT